MLVPWLPGAVSAGEKHPGETAFAERVARDHKVSVEELKTWLEEADRKQSIIDAMRRPAESLPWPDYRGIFLTSGRIASGVAFYEDNKALLDRVAAKYGVDPQYVVAILGVESNYGLNTGSYRVLDALVTLAFHYPPRADFFRGELEKFLTMPSSQLPGPREDIKGSYAGAMGWGQFMPTSVAAYARDEDGDGHIDLVHSLPDITASIANYLARHGWQMGQPVAIPAQRSAAAGSVKTSRSKVIHTVGSLARQGYTIDGGPGNDTPATLLQLEVGSEKKDWLTFKNFYVITRYNHSPLYAMAVTQLAKAIVAGVHDDAPVTATGKVADDGIDAAQ